MDSLIITIFRQDLQDLLDFLILFLSAPCPFHFFPHSEFQIVNIIGHRPLRQTQTDKPLPGLNDSRFRSGFDKIVRVSLCVSVAIPS